MTDDPINDIRRGMMRAARRRTRPWWRRPAILAPFAALAVAAPATAAIGGLWSPDATPAPPMSTTTAAASSPASAPAVNRCSPAALSQGAETTDQEPPGTLTEKFGIFRATQTEADRAGVSRFAGGRSPGALATAFVRRLPDDADGRARWVAPSLVTASDQDGRPCFGEQWVLTTAGTGGVTIGITQAAEGTIGASGTPRDPSVAVVSGLMPDGTSSVKVQYEGDTTDQRTFPVVRNAFSYRVKLPVERAAKPDLTRSAEDTPAKP